MPRELTPQEALALAKNLADLYGDAAARLLAAIGRATARGIDRPRWAEQALGNTLLLRQNAQQILTQLQTDASAQTIRMLEEAYAGGLAPTTGLSGINHRSVLALATDTQRLTTGVAPLVLRWVDDTYRRVVADTAGTAVAGATSYRDAAATAIDRLTATGVGGFTDAAGRAWSLDTYATMATRTAVGRAHLAGTLDRLTDQGREWVVVSDSPEECPQCRPFEGHVLALGADRPPPDSPLPYAGTLNSALGAGLFHPNCTHRLSAYTPGLTRPFTGDLENPDGYEQRQRQRELERRVRESKRRVAALQPLGPTPQLDRQQRLLKARRAGLRDHISSNGRKPSSTSGRL